MPVGQFTNFRSTDNKVHRLTFVLIDKVGLVYVRGNGEAVRQDGKVVNLGR